MKPFSRVSRHIFTPRSPQLRQSQRRWAQVHNVRFVATEQFEARVLEKYRDKLERKAREIGVKDIDQLQRLAVERNDRPRAALAPASLLQHPPPPPPVPSRSSPDSAPSALAMPLTSSASSTSSTPSTSTTSTTSSPRTYSPPGVKTLSSYLDIPKTLGLPSAEIEAIWRLRHAHLPSSLCATILTPTFKTIAATARSHPQFILPLPRPGQGAEIHFLQWTFPTPQSATVLFTRLAEYKLRGEFASPHTTVTCHTELADEKGLVLLQGGVVEGTGVTVEEGRWLVLWLQRFYGEVGEESGRRKRLLEGFTRGEDNWNIEQVLEEVEKIL